MSRFDRIARNLGLSLAAVTALSVLSPRGSTAAESRDAGPVWFRAEAQPLELKSALSDDVVSDRWIYHDLAAAQAEGRKTGKPVLAVFRCVPCGSAPTLDEQLSGANSPLRDLLDRFVCVRVVKMNGVNRNVFAFDPDVPYVAMFLNSDGAVYGRWGTRVSTSRSDLPRHTLPSLRTAMERSLSLHANYPANRDTLAAKSPQRTPAPDMPEDMPLMKAHPINPLEAKNCIHCHMVGEAHLAQVLMDRQPELRELWPYPLADNIGVRLDAEGLKVKSVARDSPADRAGIRNGDDLIRLDGQPLISEADVQWALHHLEDEVRPTLSVRRDGKLFDFPLALNGPWRKTPVEWRESLSPARPDVNLRPASGKDKLGIAPNEMALTVYYPRGAAAKAGFRNGDVVISVDGRTDLLTDADFLKYIHLDRPDAPAAELVVLRKGERLTLSLPLR